MAGNKGHHSSKDASTEKAKDFKGTMKKLVHYLGNYKFAILFVVISGIGSSIFSIIGPKVMGRVTTEIFNGLINKFKFFFRAFSSLVTTDFEKSINPIIISPIGTINIIISISIFIK